ncbi:MAG: hypothetical protein KGI38_10700 [Thaumarchaeota archaeon]|nr:hypothetical protein [Nitrososphaerota archaeon]
MLKILYGISPIGLGHATRSIVVVRELMRKGADVRVFSGGKAAEFIRQGGLPVDSMVEDVVPRVVDGEMRGVAWWYLRSWLAQRRNVRRVARLFESYGPDVVVCDEEFSGMAVAGERGVRRAFISDELELGFARGWLARRIEKRVEGWYKRLQGSVELLIIPDDGEDSGNRRYVGPIVRAPTMSRDEARRRYGLPAGKIVLFSMSGSGVGRELLEKAVAAVGRTGIPDLHMVVTGNRGERLGGGNVLDLGVVLDNQDLVQCADLVISTAGKSTIDEAAAAGTPIVAIPIRHHVEQERNAAALGYSADDSQRLEALIDDKLGRREKPRTFVGEEVASRLILAL